MKNNPIPLIMSRIFNVPLMIYEPKLNVILVALRDRLGVDIPKTLADDAPEKYKLPAEARSGDRQPGSRPDTVAIVPVHDTLVHRHTLMYSHSGMTSYLFVQNAFRKAMASNDISAVVLHIDSPGGEVHGAGELAQEIYEARGTKPIYAAVAGDAFSAAYYIASAAERIFLTESSGAGSIGVIAKHMDQSQYEEREGFKVTTLYAGARKNDFSPHGPLTEEAYQVGIDMITHHYDLFVQAVARNRGLKEASVRGTEAALYWGKTAITAGLADEIGTLDDAIQAALSASARPGARNISTRGILPGKEKHMERFETLAALVAEYPDFAAQLREEGKSSVDVDAAVTQERDRVLGLAGVHFGADAGEKFTGIVNSGITVDQYEAVVPENSAPAQTAEAKKMDQMLAAIKETGQQNPGTGTLDEGGKDFMTLVEEYQAVNGGTKTDAMKAVLRKNPAAHAAYVAKMN